MEEELEVELTDEELAIEKQKIRDGKVDTNTDDIKLASEANEDKKYAGVYDSIDELKKGITNLGTTLPDYVIDGMSEDALEKYYIDLRKDFSSKPKEEIEDKIEEPKVEKAKEVIGDDLWKELDKEFATKGGLSDDYYSKLNKLGIPNQVVDKYLDGLRSESKVFTENIYTLAGGEEEYKSIKAWAEENYTQEELDMVASGSQKEILFKMKAVKADYDSKNGSTSPSRLVGNTASVANGYKNQSEYIMDVMSPEYRKNAKYRAKTDQKFRDSNFS